MKCKICKIKFEPKYFLQKTCVNPACLAEWAKMDRKNKSDKVHKEKKKAFNDNDKTLRMKVAQQSFNAFIRYRDKGLGCISCDKTKDWTGQWHASHYKTTRSRPDIRFNEDNCHKGCSICNNHLSGNIGEYSPRLIEKIGQERFLALGLNKVKRYECRELKEIELLYKRKLKELQNES